MESRIMEFRRFLPYGVRKMEDGRYGFFNRQYDSLGVKTTKAIPKKTLSAIDLENDGEVFFLYDDSTIPTASVANMEAYLSKLVLLAKLKVEKT